MLILLKQSTSILDLKGNFKIIILTVNTTLNKIIKMHH